MLQNNPDNLDDLILEEKHRVAVEFIEEAWHNAVQEGIEPSILAESGIFAILTQYYSHDGEEAVNQLIDGLTARLESGHFDAKRRLQ